MKKLILLLLVPIVSFGQITIDTPSNYKEYKYEGIENTVIYSAEKRLDDKNVALINVKEIGLGGGANIVNGDFIRYIFERGVYRNQLNRFKKFELFREEIDIFDGIGEAYIIIYSHTLPFDKKNEIQVSSIITFVKNNKNYIISGSFFFESFEELFKEHLDIIKTIKFME